MSEVPSREELVRAIGKLRSGKAGGASGILPETVKVASCEVDFLSVLLDLVHTVWRESKVPSEWSDAVLA